MKTDGIKIIDYKAGNAPSVMHALERLGRKAEFARHPADLDHATHIILPGVGSAKATMASLREMGLLSSLEEAVINRNVFFLGICVGMQILFDYSEEEDTDCLGWLPGRVVRFDAGQVRVPQMGWNQVHFVAPTSYPIKDDYFYFVNSYHAVPDNQANLWGQADYCGLFTAAVRQDNIYGTQFHAEKSGEAGLALLNSILQL